MKKQIATLLLCFSSACGLVNVKVPGLSGGKGHVPQRGGAQGGASGQAASGGTINPELVTLYKSLRWDAYTSGFARPAAVKAAGLKITSQDTASPDPVWLPGWNPRQYGEQDNEMQLELAAINRTWAAQCHEDFAALRAARKQAEAASAAVLRGIDAEANFYVKLRKLNDAYAAFATSGDVADRHPYFWVGARYEVAAKLVSVVQAANLDAMAMRLVHPNLAHDFALLLKHGRPWSPDETFERDQFCFASETWGTQRTPKLPAPSSTGWETAAVRFPTTAERAEELSTQLATLVGKLPALRKVETATLDTLNVEKQPGVLEVGRAPAFAIDAVSAEGTGKRIQMHAEESRPRSFDCRSTGEINSVSPTGVVMYRQNCKTGTATTRYNVELHFAQVPPDLAIAPGTKVIFLGKIETKDLKRQEKNRGADVAYQYTMRGEGLFLSAAPTRE